MSIARHARYCLELPVALFHACREAYYALALKHVGHEHPDSWLLTRRMLHSRIRVNDFLSRFTD